MVCVERLALLRVLDRVHERALGEPDAARRDDRSHRVEAEHREPEAADLADDVLGRHAHVVEEQLAGVDALHAHLAVDAARPTTPGQTRSTMNAVTLSWARESAGPVLANTQYQSACRTPDIQHLRAGEHPVVAVGHGPRAHAHHVAAGLRLGEPERGPLLARARSGVTYRCFCSSAARRSAPGPVGSRVSSSMSAAAFEYFATSSIAIVSPRIPAPEPPYSSGTQSPVRPGVDEQLEEVLGVLARSRRSRGLAARPAPGRACGRSPGAPRARATGRSPRAPKSTAAPAGPSHWPRAVQSRLSGLAALADDPAALTRGQATPDAVLLAGGDGVLEAGLADGAQLADRLGLDRRRPR